VYYFEVFGRLPCDASKHFLFDYVMAPETQVRLWSFPQFEEATKALLRQKLTRTELSRLLQSTNSAVHGTAILECVDRPSRARIKALRDAAPWALALPRAR
jgi:hypothetical protein